MSVVGEGSAEGARAGWGQGPGARVCEGGSHALVAGGSLAGMLAAHVPGDHFDRVTVIERRYLPTDDTIFPEFAQNLSIQIIDRRPSPNLTTRHTQRHVNQVGKLSTFDAIARRRLLGGKLYEKHAQD